MTTDVEIDSALRWIKPSVRTLGAYTLRHHEPRIKLNQNESPYDVPDELKLRIARRLEGRPWNRYPPFVATRFIGAVSEATGWPEGGVLVANGSNELIQSILAVTVGAGTTVVIPEPTFTLYRLMTEVNGGSPCSVPLTAGLEFDVDAIIRAAKESDAAVIVLCTPNNPTGSALSEMRSCASTTRRARWCCWTRRTWSSAGSTESRCWRGGRAWSSCAPSARRWRWRGCAPATCSPTPRSRPRCTRASCRTTSTSSPRWPPPRC